MRNEKVQYFRSVRTVANHTDFTWRCLLNINTDTLKNLHHGHFLFCELFSLHKDIWEGLFLYDKSSESIRESTLFQNHRGRERKRENKKNKELYGCGMRNWMNAWSSLKYNSNCVFWIAIVSMSCVTLWRSWGVRMRDSFNCWLKYSKANESLKKFFVVFTNYKKARVCVCE